MKSKTKETGEDADGAAVKAAGERIAKRLARAGVGSRREAEALVNAGRVKVNGKILDSPAFNVGPDDRVEIDGAPLAPVERTRFFLFHKPAGVVTTNRDPQGRRTVFDVLPEGLPRLITVGRLDINTEGLLLMTNDGGLARMLELPETGWLRRYRVRVHGRVDPGALEALAEGTAVDGVYYGAVEATLDRQQGTNAWLTIGLREGKNREVKNILAALGLKVTRLIRISYGPFQLGALEAGAVQEIKGRTLRDQLGERLVRQAGADFDAPVTKPFSNRPVAADRKKAAKPAPDVERPVASRRRRGEDARASALDRLQTRKERPQTRQERPDTQQRSRAANVWRAPGARPVGKKKAEESASTRSEKPRSGGGRKTPTGRAGPPASGRGRTDASRRGKPGPGKGPGKR